MAPYMQDIDVADLKRISELIYQKYNYDFRNYAMSSFKRRIVRILELKKLTVSNLARKLTDTPPFINEFLDELTVNVTEMFRDPGLWRVIRDEVLPSIRQRKKQFRLWHAGCSSGEEVLTLTIVLQEMGILDDVAITATDIDGSMPERGRTCRMQYLRNSMKASCRTAICLLVPRSRLSGVITPTALRW